MDFAVAAHHSEKLKESEKKDKYLDLAREWENVEHVSIMPIVIATLDTVIQGLIKELEDLEKRERVGTIQTTALLKSARIQSRVL